MSAVAWLLASSAIGVIAGWRLEQARAGRLYAKLLARHPIANTTMPTVTRLPDPVFWAERRGE